MHYTTSLFLMHSLTQNCNFAAYMAFLLQQWGKDRLKKVVLLYSLLGVTSVFPQQKFFGVGVMLCGGISY